MDRRMDPTRATAPGSDRASGDCTTPLNMIRKKTSNPKPKARPKSQPTLPNREAIISNMPRTEDSGRILEEDRSCQRNGFGR